MINLSDFKNIHCIGIGGIGLSAIAEILLARGYKVSGSDMKESDITDKLRAQGAEIYIGHRAENVENADLVIYSAAISDENPEMVRAKEKNAVLAGRAEILGILMDEFENSIAISGTHGKTTTTSMVSICFLNEKKDPTIEVGAILKNIDGNYRIGNSKYFILESCEYNGNFLKFFPNTSIILNIDITKHADGKVTIDNYEYIPIYMYKDTSKKKQKMKLLDINKTIYNYEDYIDASISEKLYNTLKDELSKIQNILDK